MERLNTSKNRTNEKASIFTVIIISIICYANTLKNDFVYDDNITIVNNYAIQKANNISQLVNKNYFALSGELSYRPVVTLTYFLDYAIYGSKPWGYHLTNIFLHVINGLLLYKFLLILNSSNKLKPASPFISNTTLFFVLLFMSHPVLTEAVNGISFREDLLVFLFFVAAFNLYIKSKSILTSNIHQSVIIYIISCILYFLSLLSKEMAVTFPLILYSYERLYRGNNNDSSSRLLAIYKIGYIVVTMGYLYIRFFYFFNPIEKNINSWLLKDRILTLPLLILNYLKLSIFPISLSADYNLTPIKSITSPIFIISTVISLFLLATVFLTKKRQIDISFGMLFFFITLMPVYNLIPLSNPFAERYLYLPMVGLAIVALSITSMPTFYIRMHSSNYRGILKVILLIVIFIFISLTVQRNGAWENGYTLWSDTLKKSPNSARAHYGMGLSYDSKYMLNDAIREYKESIRLVPSNPDSLSALGLAYYKMASENVYNKQFVEEAFRLYMSALNLDPFHRSARYNLAYFFYEQGDIEAAIKEYNKLIRTDFYDFDAHIGLGLAYFNKRDFEKAISHYRKALDINPYSVAPYNNIGIIYVSAGQTNEAFKWFNKGLKIDPNLAETYYNLGLLNENIGKIKESKKFYERALEIKSDYKEAEEKLRGLSIPKRDNGLE